jgi:hypothetical protein
VLLPAQQVRLERSWRGLASIGRAHRRPATDIKALADQDPACERLMSVLGIGPIISSAMVGGDRQRRGDVSTSTEQRPWSSANSSGCGSDSVMADRLYI